MSPSGCRLSRRLCQTARACAQHSRRAGSGGRVPGLRSRALARNAAGLQRVQMRHRSNKVRRHIYVSARREANRSKYRSAVQAAAAAVSAVRERGWVGGGVSTIHSSEAGGGTATGERYSSEAGGGRRHALPLGSDTQRGPPRTMERLLHVSAALGAEARRRERSVGGLLEELLEQNDDGSLSDRCVQGLRERERELAAARDYRSAAAVCDLLEVLGTPQQRAPLTLADAPASLEEQIPFFFAHGFCVVADLAEGDELARLQDAWMRAEHPERERWDAARAEVLIERGVDAAAADASTPVSHFKGAEGSGRLLPNGTAPYDNGVSYPQSTFDVGNLLSKDDAFLDLADHPRLLPLLSEVCGASGLTTGASAESPYHGIVRCGGMSGRVVPSGEANEQGYLSWHRDKPPADGWPLPNYRLVKVFVAIFDIPADGGGTGVVPGESSQQNCGPLIG